MGILNVDNIQPVGGGTTITLNSSEINVGAGITFESNGQANFAGIVTATSFVGDGSGLTGAGPTLTNGSNNRVVTATGANGINGEANLTFDGDNLTITGSNHVNQILKAGGATSDLHIDFKDSSNNLEARIFCASDQGDLRFYTGGANERLRISSGGQIGIAGANYGTSGQVLTSQGSGSAPTWATASSGKILQITEGIYNVQVTVQGATSVTGLAGTITPTAAGSKILVISNQQGQIRVDSDPSQVINFYLDRDVAGGGFNNIQFQMYLGGAFPNNRRSDRMTTITQLDTPSY